VKPGENELAPKQLDHMTDFEGMQKKVYDANNIPDTMIYQEEEK